MRFLILGGNGYIGSKVVHCLVARDQYVVCAKREKSNLERLKDIRDRIVFIPASTDALDVAMNYNGFDYVINMACNYGRGNVLYDDVLEANFEFPLSILNRAVQGGIKNYITLGTGLPDNLNMYSFSKKMYGEFGKFYVEKNNINFTVLKLEMFYGADEPVDRFLPTIIRRMIKGENVDTTKGTQKRDIISSDDVVKAILMVIDDMPNGFNEIAVGTGDSPTISEIVDYVWSETGKKSIVNKGAVQSRDNEPDCVADTTMLRRLGEWNPIDWKNGLKKMINEIKGDLNENTD